MKNKNFQILEIKSSFSKSREISRSLILFVRRFLERGIRGRVW